MRLQTGFASIGTALLVAVKTIQIINCQTKSLYTDESGMASARSEGTNWLRDQSKGRGQWASNENVSRCTLPGTTVVSSRRVPPPPPACASATLCYSSQQSGTGKWRCAACRRPEEFVLKIIESLGFRFKRERASARPAAAHSPL
jgi:hypothetical protein